MIRAHDRDPDERPSGIFLSVREQQEAGGCMAWIWEPRSGRYAWCSRKAKPGDHYCGQHTEEAEAARVRRTREEWAAKSRAREAAARREMADRRRARLFPDLAAALRKIARGAANPRTIAQAALRDVSGEDT